MLKPYNILTKMPAQVSYKIVGLQVLHPKRGAPYVSEKCFSVLRSYFFAIVSRQVGTWFFYRIYPLGKPFKIFVLSWCL